MIAGHLAELKEYIRILPLYVSEQLKWAAAQNWSDLKDGKIILSDKDYVNLEHSMTEIESVRKWESHYRYLDIHILLEGKERIDWARLSEEDADERYPQRDLYLYSSPIIAQGNIHMTEGMFVVMYPWDLHRPLVAVEEPSWVRKAIFKLHLKHEVDYSE